MKNESNYDKFLAGEYSNSEWSAPLLREYYAISKQFESFNIVGKKITDLFLVDRAYNFFKDELEEKYYISLENDEYFNKLSEEEKYKMTEYRMIPDDFMLSCSLLHDCPIVFNFEKDEHLEICAAEECCFRFSKNRIPYYARTHESHMYDVCQLFECKGRTVIGVEINRANYGDYQDYLNHSHYLSNEIIDNYEEIDLVDSVVIRLDNGNGIKIEGDMDYSLCSLIDKDNKEIKKKFVDFRKSLYTWYECHCDLATDFETTNKNILFGEKGKEFAEAPYLTLAFPGGGYNNFIVLSDIEMEFDILYMFFRKFTDETIDIYDNSTIDIEDWNSLIKEYSIIVNSKTYDEFYQNALSYLYAETIRGYSIKTLLDVHGSDIWFNLDNESEIVKDLTEFTKHYSKNSKYINIFGY